MFDVVNKYCKAYYDKLPADGLKSAGLSAMYSFTASMIYIAWKTPMNQMPNDLSRAGIAAGIGFVAAGIHAITQPIFNYFFSNPDNHFNMWEEIIRNLTSISLTHILINDITPFKINLITPRSPINENFIIFPTTLIHIAIQAAASVASIFSSSIKGVKNSSPIYITA